MATPFPGGRRLYCPLPTSKTRVLPALRRCPNAPQTVSQTGSSSWEQVSRDWPYNLTEDEQGLGPSGLLKKYLFAPLPKQISESEAWIQPSLRNLDEMTLGEYMRSQGASESALHLIRDTQYLGTAVEQGSALSTAMADIGLFMSGPLFLLSSGNDRLPAAMARHLPRHIRYGVEAEVIRDTNNGVEVRGQQGGQPTRFSADRVICTVPAPVLRTLDIIRNPTHDVGITEPIISPEWRRTLFLET